MRSFREKYPGLTEEQLRIKYKIWEREKQREQELYESLKKKIPFWYRDGDDDTGDYAIFGDFGSHGTSGVASDAPLSGAEVSFLYADGSIRKEYTDLEGKFTTPSDFYEGDIVVRGGKDIVTGVDYQGEFKVDAEFFFKYKAITPFTHVANHIWLNTPTKTPDEAMSVTLNYISDFIGMQLPEIDPDSLFNDDHVKLTIDGVHGAKEIQAINTLIEIYSDLIGNAEAKKEYEILDQKKKTLEEIGNALLVKINGQTNKTYSQNIFEFHDVTIGKKYKDCCSHLITKASDLISNALSKDPIEATSHIQALNLAIKTEWAKKAFSMTEDPSITKYLVWESIENKNLNNLVPTINLPQS